MSDGTRVGLFGGTFDPVHCAHVAVAEEAVRRLGLDEVLFVPAAHPPHKSGATVAGYEDRYRMVELACRDHPGLKPSRLEEGTGKSYSILTIEKLRAQLGSDAVICFLIGADAFAEITTWHRWRDVIRSVEFIVMTRPGHDYRVPEGARVRRLDTADLPVSSSEIRRRLAAGADTEEIPEAVRAYIRERGLYRDRATTGRGS